MTASEDKRVLFIGTPFMNIYQDIIDEFHRKGYVVDFIAEQVHTEDPDNVRGGNYDSPEGFLAKNTKHWTDLLNSPQFCNIYDILFVLDGQSVAPCVFSILRERNSSLYAVNYLFDTTKGVYRFDKNFRYFDKVFTFDIEESKKYGIGLMPIYWVPAGENVELKYKFFGLGRYNRLRAKLFRELIGKCKKDNIPYYIKLQGEHITCFPLKWLARVLLGKNKNRVTLKDYYSDFFINKPVPLDEYRRLVAESEIIIDTNAPHQDGLTARFMWALGQGKKILTTNKSSMLYDFYTPEQIYLVDDISHFANSDSFATFMNTQYALDENVGRIVVNYRIDNWLDHLLRK